MILYIKGDFYRQKGEKLAIRGKRWKRGKLRGKS